MNFCKAGTRVWHRKHGKGTVISTIRGDEGVRIRLDSGGTKTVNFLKYDPTRGYVDDLPYPKGWRKYAKQANEDVSAKAKEVVNQLLEGDKPKTNVQPGDNGAPYRIDAEFAGPEPTLGIGDVDAAKQMAKMFGLRYKRSPNGNPSVVGSLMSREEVYAFAKEYGGEGRVVFEPASRGTDVCFENY